MSEENTPTNQEGQEETPESSEEIPEEELPAGESTSDKTNQEVLKQLKELQAQKEHFRDKTKKLEDELTQIKSAFLPKKEEKKDDGLKDLDHINLMKTVSALKDFSGDELDAISKYARGAGLTLEQASKDPFIILAVQAQREKVAKDKKVPEPTYRGIVHNKKSISEMTKKELEANYSDIAIKAIEQGKKKRMEL